MRTIQLAGSLLLGTMLMVGCTENFPTESTDTPAFQQGPPEFAGPPEFPGRPEFPGPPGEVCVPFKSLVGTWTLTSFTFEGGPDLVDLGLLLVVTFMTDGTGSQSVTGDTGNFFCDIGTTCTDDGRYIQTDVNLLTCDPHCDHILDYTISGNTLTISFDGGEEHTPFTAIFERTSASGQPDQLCGPVESLVGTWEAINFTFEGGQNLVDEVDLVLIVTFMSDGTFTDFVDNDPANLFCDGTTCEDDGRYIQTDVNLLTCDPHCDHILDYTISGNTATISFDGGEEHTPFTAIFERTR